MNIDHAEQRFGFDRLEGVFDNEAGAEMAGKRVFEIDPQGEGYFVLIWSYCSADKK